MRGATRLRVPGASRAATSMAVGPRTLRHVERLRRIAWAAVVTANAAGTDHNHHAG